MKLGSLGKAYAGCPGGENVKSVQHQPRVFWGPQVPSEGQEEAPVSRLLSCSPFIPPELRGCTACGFGPVV